MSRAATPRLRTAAIGFASAQLAATALAAPPCGAPSGQLDFGAMPLHAIAGDTTAGTDGASAYPCVAALLDGPEVVYELILPHPGHVVVVQTGGVAGLEFLVLPACDESTCAGAGCGSPLPAGTSYLVVDGAGGASGAFEIDVAYEPSFQRWDACQDPTGGTLATDTVRPSWNFDDFAYCFSDPMSHNYPDGCTFAMYALVQCGTSMHIPLYDVESCSLRIYDVFRGRHVELAAVSTGGWSMTGHDISWQDCDGMDPRWNNETTDISFADPTGLCGLFRLEFENHAGFIWDLYANCTGTADPRFSIHDSLCSAFREYAPLPSLSLVSATVTEDCPEVMVTYTVLNDGCHVARGIPVRLIAAGVEVATDVLPEAPSGQTITRSFSATLPGSGASLTLVIDPDDVVVECNEVGGVACDLVAGLETLPLSACAPGGCTIRPAALGPTQVVCAGRPVTIDASASGGLNCASGTLQYQLRSLEGVLQPWSAVAELEGLVATRTTDCFVDVRCSSTPGCANSVRLRVEVERAPELDPLSVRAASLGCEGIAVTWTPAQFFGATGTGVYNVYRSSSSCADAAVRAPVASGLTTPGFVDGTTLGGTTYYYVVEAEDGTAATACAARGPVAGGASTRVDATEGACQGGLDASASAPDTLPRVGGSLRLGGSAPAGRRYGHDFVELDWVTDRPLDVAAGEHVHVLRSESASGVGSLLGTEPPLLVGTTFTDASAGDTGADAGVHVWHYIVAIADACDRDNAAIDDP